ncbi:NUDIX hydrolase [Micromonospora zamorensis]|uniref:NUDIX hydrolase n=1 Tax=Micromonospora zamorensis TaxID=709883 RepID=UPI0033C6095A
MAETQTEPDISYIASVTRVRAAAGMILRDQAGRVLVVHPTYKDVWEVPGGTVEPNESPAEACAREIREELGLAVLQGRCCASTGCRRVRRGTVGSCSCSTAGC